MTDRIPPGDLRLLETDEAKALLASTMPARVAYVAADGTPRVVPTWFHWTGAELVMRMARIALGPMWVSLVDFATRPPEVMAGT